MNCHRLNKKNEKTNKNKKKGFFFGHIAKFNQKLPLAHIISPNISSSKCLENLIEKISIKVSELLFEGKRVLY